MSTEPTPLKLRAEDSADVQVIAAVLQDAIAPVCDMAFRGADQNFIMVVQRFCWDCVNEGQAAPQGAEAADHVFERICCALDVSGVESVQYQGFDQEDPSQMLDLLTMALEEDGLRIVFAGGAQLRLRLKNWRICLSDFGESWPTTHCPRHAT